MFGGLADVYIDGMFGARFMFPPTRPTAIPAGFEQITNDALVLLYDDNEIPVFIEIV